MRTLSIALLLASATVLPVQAQDERSERSQDPPIEMNEGRDRGEGRRGMGSARRDQMPQAQPQPIEFPQSLPQAQPQTQRQRQPEPQPQRDQNWNRERGERGGMGAENGGGWGNREWRRRGDQSVGQSPYPQRPVPPVPAPPIVTPRPDGPGVEMPNGRPINGAQWDRNGNGRIDRDWDRNRNGRVDKVWDRNRDGVLDRRWDRNGDGSLDRRWDRNGDGRYDRIRHGQHDGWGNGGHRWDRGWHSDRRYDWRGYRNQYRNIYRAPSYYNPYGQGRGYSRFSIGFYLNSLFYSDRYQISDPWRYRLPDAYGPYRWVRYYDDVLLVDIYSGEVVDVIHDFFW